MKKVIIIIALAFLLTGCGQSEQELPIITEEEIVENPLEMSLKDFTLDNVYKEAQLKETNDLGKDYTDKIIFVGDSVPLYYVITNNITGSQLWHKEGMSLKEVFSQPLYVNHMETGKTMVEIFKEKQPNVVIISLGMNSVATMSKDYFIGEYTKLIMELKNVSPNTKIIINSIPPVAASYDEGNYELNNTSINEFNYYILKMCSEQDVKFINTAKVLKDENGQCKIGYFIDESGSARAHQTDAGNKKVFDYIQTHAIDLNK